MVSQHDRFVTARGPDYRWIGWADSVFLWVPNAGRPGLLAYGLGLARATLFPVVLLSIAAFVATEFAPGHRLADADAFGQDLALATFVVF